VYGIQKKNKDKKKDNKNVGYDYGSRIGFSQSMDRMALLPTGDNPRWQPAAIMENFEWPYLSNGSLDPLHVLFHGRVIAIGGWSGLTSDWTKSKTAAGRYLEKFRMAIYLCKGSFYQ